MKKQLVFLIGMMLLFSIVPMVIAQSPNEGVTIPEGDIISSDFITLEIVLSTTLGGLISTIEETIKETVNLGGVPVHIIEQVKGISDFEILAFDSGISPNFEAITTGAIFETSKENVDVRGVVSQWETYNVDSLLPAHDAQSYVGLSVPIILVDGFVTINGAAVNIDYAWGDGINSGSGSSALTTCADGFCPTRSEVDDFFGIISTSMSYALISQMDDLIVIRILGQGGAPIGYIADLNNDGNWNFVEYTDSGYSVTSQQGQTLMLLPASETFDIYAIIPN